MSSLVFASCISESVGALCALRVWVAMLARDFHTLLAKDDGQRAERRSGPLRVGATAHAQLELLTSSSGAPVSNNCKYMRASLEISPVGRMSFSTEP